MDLSFTLGQNSLLSFFRIIFSKIFSMDVLVVQVIQSSTLLKRLAYIILSMTSSFFPSTVRVTRYGTYVLSGKWEYDAHLMTQIYGRQHEEWFQRMLMGYGVERMNLTSGVGTNFLFFFLFFFCAFPLNILSYI